MLPNDNEVSEGAVILTLDEQREPVEIELTLPIPLEIAGEEITSLKMNPPTGATLAKVQSGTDAQRTIGSLAVACNVRAEVIEALHIRDFNRVSAIFLAFGA